LIPKLGVNIRSRFFLLSPYPSTDVDTDDATKLYRDYGILARNLVELGALASAADPRFASIYRRPIVALAKVVAFYLYRALDKGPVRTSDWERELTRDQIICRAYFIEPGLRILTHGLDAANDAHCAIMVYKRIMTIARSSKLELDPATYTSDLARELQRPNARESRQDAPTVVAPVFIRHITSNAKPQHLQAYNFWRAGHGLLDICIRMRSAKNPLRDVTVM
jgi:hypothetical protein